ncbi:hypothetical protein DJ568_16750 [Mucilaginibacter hurinus]|uniref:Uncharacterized protein n=1 Tax=Mucilaginibacter hurinus TaxID=2201324 RepID=A0A367GJN8_9SPHI|nr:hypothetical protein [Mucilaginibacter hurinus]RCH53684.1 hypothetical protein DJ568_16750 [Mucilaginibacter hurinus]
MSTYKLIQQVTEKHFKIRQIEANSAHEYQQEKNKIGVAYDDINLGGWQKQNYPAGDFIIHWRTNFGYGKQEYAYAYILYHNRKKDTRTFVKCYKNVASLEEVAGLMNKYANLSAEELMELFENVVDRLGMYHYQFDHSTSYDFMLEAGYTDEVIDDMYHLDYDSVCLRELQKSMATAVTLQVRCEILYRISTHLNENENKVVDDIKTRLAGIYEGYKIGGLNLILKGKYGSHHLIGNFDYQANPPRSHI